MSSVVIELPSQEAQREFNLRRWEEVLRDPALAQFPGRIETDRHGRTIMSPPPAPRHGSLQLKIGALLQPLMPEGEVLTECPISTADGVRAADGAWASESRMRELGSQPCFPRAPEICVEVRSPGESAKEAEEKKTLYFDAGAKEVWMCDKAGRMTFFHAGSPEAAEASQLCPAFPVQISLRASFRDRGNG